MIMSSSSVNRSLAHLLIHHGCLCAQSWSALGYGEHISSGQLCYGLKDAEFLLAMGCKIRERPISVTVVQLRSGNSSDLCSLVVFDHLSRDYSQKLQRGSLVALMLYCCHRSWIILLWKEDVTLVIQIRETGGL